jgi:hypothetical protein
MCVGRLSEAFHLFCFVPPDRLRALRALRHGGCCTGGHAERELDRGTAGDDDPDVTSIVLEKKTCAVCRARVEVRVLQSSSTFGPPDTDTRPAPMLRDALHLGVERCASCGYCAQDLSTAGEGRAATVRSVEYTQLARADSIPEVVRDYLAMSLLDETAGAFREAGWASLRAAWGADDANDEVRAKTCRERAAGLFQRALAAGQTIAEDGFEHALLTDVLRRAGKLDEARAIAEAEHGASSGLLRALLDRQLAWIARQDTGSHTLDEVPREPRAPDPGGMTLEELDASAGTYAGSMLRGDDLLLMAREEGLVAPGDRLRCFEPRGDHWYPAGEVRVRAFLGPLGAECDLLTASFGTRADLAGPYRAYLAERGPAGEVGASAGLEGERGVESGLLSRIRDLLGFGRADRPKREGGDGE